MRRMADGDDLLGGLPKTRPTRAKRADNRPKAAPGSKATTKKADAAKVDTVGKAKAKAAPRGNARPAAARTRPKQADATPGPKPQPPQPEPQGTGGLAGLAQQGLGLGTSVVKGVLKRLPRP
jgi:hypothetical protein